MAEVAFFKPRSTITAEANLNDFIAYCRDELTLYDAQGGFASNVWHTTKTKRRVSMTFSTYSVEKNPYKFQPLSEPFLSFAKAYVRFTQTHREVSSIPNRMVALRTLHDALVDVHGECDLLKTDGLVQLKIVELLDLRYKDSDILFRVGGELVKLYKFLREKFIASSLPEWSNPWKRCREKAIRTDPASMKWQEERCPSQHQMLALADCFAKANTEEDKYWSSVLALLMFAPSRASELNQLTIDSLHEDGNVLAVRWYANKGYGYTIKWVPDSLQEMVRSAFSTLIEIGAPARRAAKFAHENPGVFFRHEGCITPVDFPEDAPLSALQFAHAMNLTENTIKKLEGKGESPVAWDVLSVKHRKWLKRLTENGNPSYRKLAGCMLERYRGEQWPNIPGMDRPIWEALLLIREYEFHTKFNPRVFSWVMPTVNQVNDQLSMRSNMKNPVKTIFQRNGIFDEDGSDIELTSHQLRVWLCTNAERGGMDAWKLAQWAGRARIEDNKHYDLRTREERQHQVNALMGLGSRPNALEAIKLNLPVTYEALGLRRTGIADVTEYGMCVHDFAMSPCQKGGECMTCRDHVCIKGMANTLERIKELEGQIELQLERSRAAAGDGVYGASRWEAHLTWKLAHVRTQRTRLESDDTPEGAVLWTPAEYDPSPVQRSLKQQGYEASVDKDKASNDIIIARLLGRSDAEEDCNREDDPDYSK